MQLVLNVASSRRTSSVIGFRPETNERVFDSDALALSKWHPESTYSYLRDLLGRKDAESVKSRIQNYVTYSHKLFNPTVADALGNVVDFPFVAVQHDESTVYAVHELVGMLFQQARAIAEKADGGRIVDCAITVPVFFTEDERQAIIDAASLSGLHVLSLVDQGTAIATQYAIGQTFEGDDYKRIVLFFDFGESTLQLTAAQYTPDFDEKRKQNVTQVQILGSTWSQVGGRDFTRVLVDYWIKSLRTKISDIDTKPRVWSKLWTQMRKTREVLSANKETSFLIPNLDGDFDFSASITRETFDGLIKHEVEMIIPALDELLKITNLQKSDFYAVEMLGGAGRTPLVQELIKNYFDKTQMDTHMNADESAVFGAAFLGGALSGRYKTKGFKIKDIAHRNVTVMVTTFSEFDSSEETHESESESGREPSHESVLKPSIRSAQPIVRGSRLGMKKTLSFYTLNPFTVALEYTEAEDDPLRLPSERRFIDLYNFSSLPKNISAIPSQILNSDNKTKEEEDIQKLGVKFYNMTSVPKISVKVELDEKGMIVISGHAEVRHSVKTTRLIEVEETNLEKEENGDEEKDNKGSESTYVEEGEDEKENVEGTENEQAEKGEPEEETRSPVKVSVEEWVEKKEEIQLTYMRKYGPLPQFLRKKSLEVLDNIEKAERLRVKIQELKNELESNLYAVRSNLYESPMMSVTNREQRETLSEVVSELFTWLEEESFDATLLTVREKTTKLDKLVKPISLRLKEVEALPKEVEHCRKTLASVHEFSRNVTEIKEVTEEELLNLYTLISATEDFLRQKLLEQSKKKPYEDPVVTSEQIEKKCKNVVSRAAVLFKRPNRKAKQNVKVEQDEKDKEQETEPESKEEQAEEQEREREQEQEQEQQSEL
eukprot:TRINITY_DN10588_c0_g1_i7.p1 TRINITY_DN10588_c0_g1~~TRINITY_DN10588_c0_g1_i7.p1  ORF type:complete len:888 (-),score=230.68 TRINITY_DN10588_c0_g1_i7:145-2808(-)